MAGMRPIEPAEPAVEAFFAAVADALRPLPAGTRAEILAELRLHLGRRWREEPGADVARLLAELGTPAEIAAQAGLPRRSGGLRSDTPAIVAIVLMALFWPVGLIVAGASGRCRVRSLAWATASSALGWVVTILFLVLSLVAAMHASTGPGPHAAREGVAVAGIVLAGVAGLIGGPLAGALHLIQALRRPAARPVLPASALLVVAAGGLLVAAATLWP